MNKPYSTQALTSGCQPLDPDSQSVSAFMPKSGSSTSGSPRITPSMTTRVITTGSRIARVEATSTSTMLRIGKPSMRRHPAKDATQVLHVHRLTFDVRIEDRMIELAALQYPDVRTGSLIRRPRSATSCCIHTVTTALTALEIRVEASGSQQLGMGARLDDPALLQHDDAVRMTCRGDPVRDEQRGALRCARV